MVRFIPGTIVIDPLSDSEEEEEDHDEDPNVVETLDVELTDACRDLPDRNDGWSHCFYCIGEDNKPVRDIIHEAVYIHFSQNERIESTFTFDTWQRMGETLSKCQKLERFAINNVRLTPKILTALFRSERGSYDFPLEILSLMSGEFGSEGMRVLHPFLKARTVPMKSLSLREARMDEEGAVLLGEVLEMVPVMNLDVRSNNLGFRGISKILSAKHARSLTYLQLGVNSFGRFEIAQVAKFLQRNDVILDHLSIGERDFDVEWVKILLHSLEKNSNLGKLVISPWSSWFDEFDGTECVDEATFHTLEKAIISLTFNTSSMQALCKSNHSFRRLNELSLGVLSPVARTLLMINGMNISTSEKIRFKLRWIYFEGSFCLQPFVPMKLTFMPHVLELVTRRRDNFRERIQDKWQNLGSQKETGDLNGVYRFVRNWNLPHLFSFSSNKYIGDKKREKTLLSGSRPEEMDVFSHFQMDCLLSEINHLPDLDGNLPSNLNGEASILPLKSADHQKEQTEGIASLEGASEGCISNANNFINSGTTYNMNPWG